MFRPDDLRRIVVWKTTCLALTRVSGIGKKTAQQVFLELKYKLKADGVPGRCCRPGIRNGPGTRVPRRALTGLVNLGYAEEE